MRRVRRSLAARAWRRALVPLLVVGTTAAVSVIRPLPARAATAAVTAASLGYPYPNAPDCNEQTGADCAGDKWGFVQGQCHSWVAYRLNELNATELDGSTFNDTWHMPSGDEWGSVWRWDTAAQEAGVTMDDSPALGSLAWWSKDGGHVAYVEAVNADGSVRISEMNRDYHNSFDFALLRRGHRWPTAFLHVADRPALPAAPTKVVATPGSRRATVTWKVPPPNGSTITGYVVTVFPSLATVAVGAGASSAPITNLRAGRRYRFSVHATSDHGDGTESHRTKVVVPTP